VYLTGSTAFRGPTHTAITKILGVNTVSYGFTGASLSGASQAIFEGDLSGNHIIVKTSWSGSVAGIQTVSQGIAIPFLPDSTTRSTGAGTSGATTATAQNGGDVAIPDIGMSDNFQVSAPFTSPVLADTKVGVIPFKWVASKDAPAGLNMTPQLAKALFGAGNLPLSEFTGSASDETTQIFALGRDPDSGTRVAAFAESGVGVFNQVVQYQPTVSSGAVTSQIPWPVTVVNGITFPQGDAGFSGGGTLATTLTATSLQGVGGFYVSYLGTGDATTAINGGAHEMSYNGVTLDPSFDLIRNGKYTFWAYEHLMYKSTLSGVKKSTADSIANQILTVDSPVLISSMRCRRLQDGGTVAPTF
jgi:ABC-type phosphate transport system substrate-binding protein